MAPWLLYVGATCAAADTFSRERVGDVQALFQVQVATKAIDVQPMLLEHWKQDIAKETTDALQRQVLSTLRTGEALLQENVQFSRSSSRHMGKQLAIPLVALILGIILLKGGNRVNLIGKLLVYFGAQTVMSIYMKAVLSSGVVSMELHYKGFPAAFAVTAMQQVTAFVLFVFLYVGSKVTPWPYQPKVVSKRMEILAVLAFSLTFTLNIALNNFGLALVPLSVNLIIRSCQPIFTYLAQLLMDKLQGLRPQTDTIFEVFLMCVGVIAAAVAVVAKAKGSKSDHGLDSGENTATLVLGVIMCIASLLASAFNMVLAGSLGSMKLNPLDTTLYMSIPVAVFLIIPIFCIPHACSWPGTWTDWHIVEEVARLSPGSLGLAFLSGVLALAHNVLQYTLVQTISPCYASFAGNFNKAATIGLALAFQMEVLPQKAAGIIMILAIVANIIAFTAYNFLKTRDSSDKAQPIDEAPQGVHAQLKGDKAYH